jgi:hypothetical protein
MQDNDEQVRSQVAALLGIESSEVLGYALVARVRATVDSSDMVVAQTSADRPHATTLLLSGIGVMWNGMPHPLNGDEEGK